MKPRAMRAECIYGQGKDFVRVRPDVEGDRVCIVSIYDVRTGDETSAIYLRPDKAKKIAERLIEIANYCESLDRLVEQPEEII